MDLGMCWSGGTRSRDSDFHAVTAQQTLEQRKTMDALRNFGFVKVSKAQN